MNEDAVKQGMEMNSFDVILCCNVSHNARNASEVLVQFSSLLALAPGGSLVFIKPFRRHNYPLLVSIEFFPELTGFTDLRATTDQTFFTREQWLRLLDEAGATLCDCAPVAESALASSGQGCLSPSSKPIVPAYARQSCAISCGIRCPAIWFLCIYSCLIAYHVPPMAKRIGSGC